MSAAVQVWNISAHAVGRYLERHAPDLDQDAAHETLLRLVENAQDVGPADRGRLYAAPEAPHLLLVVTGSTVTTVLDAGQRSRVSKRGRR